MTTTKIREATSEQAACSSSNEKEVTDIMDQNQEGACVQASVSGPGDLMKENNISSHCLGGVAHVDVCNDGEQHLASHDDIPRKIKVDKSRSKVKKMSDVTNKKDVPVDDHEDKSKKKRKKKHRSKSRDHRTDILARAEQRIRDMEKHLRDAKILARAILGKEGSESDEELDAIKALKKHAHMKNELASLQLQMKQSRNERQKFDVIMRRKVMELSVTALMLLAHRHETEGGVVETADVFGIASNILALSRQLQDMLREPPNRDEMASIKTSCLSEKDQDTIIHSNSKVSASIEAIPPIIDCSKNGEQIGCVSSTVNSEPQHTSEETLQFKSTSGEGKKIQEQQCSESANHPFAGETVGKRGDDATKTVEFPKNQTAPKKLEEEDENNESCIDDKTPIRANVRRAASVGRNREHPTTQLFGAGGDAHMIKELKQKLGKAIKEQSIAQAEVHQLQHQLVESQARVESLEKERDSDKSTIAELKDQLRIMIAKVTQISTELKSKGIEIERLQYQVAQSEEKAKQLRCESDEKGDKIILLNHRLKSMLEESKEAQIAATAELNQREHQLSQSQEKLEWLEGERDACKFTIRELEEELCTMETRVTQMAAELSAKADEVERLQRESAQKEEKANELQEKATEKQSNSEVEINQLQHQLAQSQARIESLEEECDAGRGTIAELKQQLHLMDTKMTQMTTEQSANAREIETQRHGSRKNEEAENELHMVNDAEDDKVTLQSMQAKVTQIFSNLNKSDINDGLVIPKIVSDLSSSSDDLDCKPAHQNDVQGKDTTKPLDDVDNKGLAGVGAHGRFDNTGEELCGKQLDKNATHFVNDVDESKNQEVTVHSTETMEDIGSCKATPSSEVSGQNAQGIASWRDIASIRRHPLFSSRKRFGRQGNENSPRADGDHHSQNNMESCDQNYRIEQLQRAIGTNEEIIAKLRSDLVSLKTKHKEERYMNKMMIESLSQENKAYAIKVVVLENELKQLEEKLQQYQSGLNNAQEGDLENHIGADAAAGITPKKDSDPIESSHEKESVSERRTISPGDQEAMRDFKELAESLEEENKSCRVTIEKLTVELEEMRQENSAQSIKVSALENELNSIQTKSKSSNPPLKGDALNVVPTVDESMGKDVGYYVCNISPYSKFAKKCYEHFEDELKRRGDRIARLQRERELNEEMVSSLRSELVNLRTKLKSKGYENARQMQMLHDENLANSIKIEALEREFNEVNGVRRDEVQSEKN